MLSKANGCRLALMGISSALAIMAATVDHRPAAAQFVCVGNPTGADVPPGTADGDGASAVGAGAVACGSFSSAGGDFSTAVGGNAEAPGQQSTSVGNQAGQGSSGNFNTAIGAQAGLGTAGDNNSWIGFTAGNNTQGSNNVALGSGAGNFANPTAINNTVAIGTNALASANNAVAIGGGAGAAGANALAVGTGANANFANSAAFGTGAAATRENQQVFGTASNTYTMPGIASAASRAAQTGAVQLVTSDSGGNLATASLADLGIASTGDIAGINNQLASVNARLNDVSGRADKAVTGVAMAFAMAGVPTLMPYERFAVAMNWGTFQGQNGLAFNAALRLTDSVQLNGGIGYGANQDLVGGRVGLRVGW